MKRTDAHCGHAAQAGIQPRGEGASERDDEQLRAAEEAAPAVRPGIYELPGHAVCPNHTTRKRRKATTAPEIATAATAASVASAARDRRTIHPAGSSTYSKVGRRS